MGEQMKISYNNVITPGITLNSLYGSLGNSQYDLNNLYNVGTISYTGINHNPLKYSWKVDITDATINDDKIIDIITKLTNKIDKLEKELNDIKMMIEYSPDNTEKMDELKKDFNELANKMI